MKPSQMYDELVKGILKTFEGLPDPRSAENVRYKIKDAAMSAFGIFFSQSSSFLAYQRMMEKSKGRSNVQILFGAERVPNDGQICNLLDPQEPEFLANFTITLNLLAFLFHTLLDLLDEQYRALRLELVARKDFFNDLRALLRYMLFDNWNHLMHFMLVGLELVPDT